MAWGDEPKEEPRNPTPEWIVAIFTIVLEYVEGLGPIHCAWLHNEQDEIWELKVCPHWLYTQDKSEVIFKAIGFELHDIWDELLDPPFGASSFYAKPDFLGIYGAYDEDVSDDKHYYLHMYYKPIEGLKYVYGQLTDDGFKELEDRPPVPDNRNLRPT